MGNSKNSKWILTSTSFLISCTKTKNKKNRRNRPIWAWNSKDLEINFNC